MKPPFSSLLLIVFVLISMGLKCKQEDKTSLEPSYPSFFVETGPMKEAADQTIQPTGGIVRIDEAGHPLNGFSIDVPGSSYPEDLSFKVSYAEALSKDFGKQMKIVSPVIDINNGGEYAKYPMTVTIPLNGSKAEDAMGFTYNEKSGKIEGLPTVANGDTAITVFTRHFSPVFAGAYTGDEDAYMGEFDSGFRPGKDDWQMGNPGNVLASPGGQCSGQSIGMLWYFREKRMNGGSAPQLNGLYESDGENLSPGFWNDDANALKLCAVLQSLDDDLRVWSDDEAKTIKVHDFTDRQLSLSNDRTMKHFANAFLASSNPAPQFILLANKEGRDRHAMVVYGMSDGSLLISDPNFPGSKIDENFQPVGLNRKIVYDKYTKTYKPYTSGAHTFYQFAFLGEGAIVPWKSVERNWSSIETGSFEERYFPAYQLYSFDEEGHPSLLENGTTLNPDGILKLRALTAVDRMSLQCNVYDKYFRRVDISKPLPPGIQKLGIEPRHERFGNNQWIGFHWVEVLVPERRINMEYPRIYSGIDFSAVATLESNPLRIDSIRFLISDAEKSFLFMGFTMNGSKQQHYISVSIDNAFTGEGTYTGAIGQYIPEADEIYFEAGKTATVEITKWGAGILAGSFSFQAIELGGPATRNITCSFRYPK